MNPSERKKKGYIGKGALQQSCRAWSRITNAFKNRPKNIFSNQYNNLLTGYGHQRERGGLVSQKKQFVRWMVPPKNRVPWKDLISGCKKEFPLFGNECNKCGSNITGFRPVIDLACMRDVVNKLSSNSKKINPLVNLEFRGRVVFNADSVLGTDSRTSMNSQVTKPGNIAEDSSIISARVASSTSIENAPTTDTGLLSNLHVFLLVHNSHPPPCRLNCLRQQKVENLDDSPSRSHKQVGQAVLPIVACWQSNISSCDAEFPMATHIGKIDINLLGTSVQSKPPFNWLDPLSNQKLTALHPSSVTLQLLQNLIMSILSFRQCRTSIANTPKSIHNIRKDAHQILVDVARNENEVQANTDIEFQRNNEISTFVRLGHQLNSTIFALFLLVLVSSTKQKVFRGEVLSAEEERYQVLRFKRMEMSASESGESALSDLLKLNTSGGLSKHRYAFLEANGSATLNVEDARTLESREVDGRWKPQPNA
ncbi:hypothetical protein LguiA_004872 [Lonicera macranthoides]